MKHISHVGIVGIRVHDRHLRGECRIVPDQMGEIRGENRRVRRRRMGNSRERLALRRVREVCSESIMAFQFFLRIFEILRDAALYRRLRGACEMKNHLVVLFAGFAAVMPALAVDVAPAADQIASSVLAAPKERRADATVLGYDEKGSVVTLRKGTNEMVCLADDPNVKAFSVACYHKDLEPFMARGRELAKDVKGKERHESRWKEVDEGKVKMPREPRMLYVLTGSGFDAAKGEVTDAYLRWVVYVPYATPETTGLSITPGTAPWLMYPGTAGAHIMISPPKK